MDDAVTYVPVQCPRCGAHGHGRVVVTSSPTPIDPRNGRIRYHRCNDCSHRFKSVQRLPSRSHSLPVVLYGTVVSHTAEHWDFEIAATVGDAKAWHICGRHQIPKAGTALTRKALDELDRLRIPTAVALDLAHASDLTYAG